MQGSGLQICNIQYIQNTLQFLDFPDLPVNCHLLIYLFSVIKIIYEEYKKPTKSKKYKQKYITQK